MRYNYLTMVLLFLIVTIISCNKDKETKGNFSTCYFEQIDDNMDGLINDSERKIMNNCTENLLSSKSDIETNLIGKWKLIGHGEGWLPTISQPCGYITISSDELIFEFRNNYIDTITTNEWEIEEVNSGISKYFKLKIDSEYQEGLWITNFCEHYMFGDATPSDGNMYLYEKVK
ncbi:MAG: hypothetical protein IPM42_05785 [Saprospiraceae bacterium]|nr:hypothetical protein [Saprospiraceae bacterium]